MCRRCHTYPFSIFWATNVRDYLHIPLSNGIFEALVHCHQIVPVKLTDSLSQKQQVKANYPEPPNNLRYTAQQSTLAGACLSIDQNNTST